MVRREKVSDPGSASLIRDPEILAALRANIARFVRERLVPNEALVAETDAIPAAIVAEMKALGLFGLSIPEDYGGLGLTMEEEVVRRVRARPHLAGVPLADRHQQRHRLAGDHPRRHARSRRRATCRDSRRGELIASFALTEPGSGSDAASLVDDGARATATTTC